MKRILLILAVFALTITSLHAQVPVSPIIDDPALRSAVTSMLPPAYAAYGSLILVVGMIFGRAFTALKANGGLVGIYNAIVHGVTIKLLIASLCLLALPSCGTMQKLGAALSTPKARQVEMDLAQIGLVGAVLGGVVSPGDALTIAKGVAIVTSPDDGSSKAVGLTKLGLDTAIAKGVVKPGDVVTIKEATATITPAAAPTPPAVIEMTSGK